MKNDAELLAQILNDSDEMIQVSDAKTFTMLYANNPAKKYTGHGDQPYLGHHCYEYMMGLKEQCPFCPMLQLKDQESSETEVDNGNEVYAVKTKKILWEGQEAFIEYAWDITKIRRSQQVYESQVQTLIASIPNAQGIFHMDITEDSVISVNGSASTALAMRALTNVNAVILAIAACVPEKEKSEEFYRIFCRESLLKAYENGKMEIIRDTNSYFDDGSIRPARITVRLIINPQSNHLECIVYGLDITAEWQERKKYEEAREAHQKELEEHLAEEKRQKEKEKAYQRELKKQLEVINAIGGEYKSIYLIDCEKRTWSVFKTDGSKMIQGALARSAVSSDYQDAMRIYIENFVVEEDRKSFLEHASLQCLLEETPDEGIHSLSYDRIVESGRQHWQAITAKFTADDGKVYLVLGFRDVHDIVEKQISQENALRDALMLAKRANRAKTTFLNNMSHDIRTPMNAIIGFTDLAQTHLNDPEQVQDYLKKIHTSSSHLLSLINEILDMSRIESGEVKLEENEVHLPDVLHELRTIIQGQVDAKQQNLFIDTVDVVHEDVVTDKLRLNQVLLNIVGNAIKYTDCGGSIEVRIIERPCTTEGYANYIFSIRDNGMGMSSEFAEHVFDAFTRERTSTVSGIQGTGLGMSITKNIVDMMNGTITVESEIGKGSEFVVNVDFKLAENMTDLTPITELKGARILVVDDNINTCQSVSRMLRSIDMRPDWSTSGKEAVIRAREAAELREEYKAYIIDYMMPDMNGIETVRRIRRTIGGDVPIIVLTAYDWVELEEEAREAGVTGFVSKPIFISELRTALSGQREVPLHAEKTSLSEHDYRGKRLLLVEDNELNREIATFILEDAGIVVDIAEDGIEAVDIMNQAREDQYDLILMDIQMPKMDGYTATREIRTLKNNRKANIPIVAMTANAFDEDRKKSFEAGMNGHIAKPIDINVLAAVLDRFLKD